MKTLIAACAMTFSPPYNFDCVEYVKNYDGDTITVNIPYVHPLIGREVSVRVAGIDAPEMNGKTDCEKEFAKMTRDYVFKILKEAKTISLRNVEQDKYFRLLADVIVDGDYLHAILMRDFPGIVLRYEGGTKIPFKCRSMYDVFTEAKEARKIIDTKESMRGS